MPPTGRPLYTRRKGVQGQHVVARGHGSHAADGGLLVAAHGGGVVVLQCATARYEAHLRLMLACVRAEQIVRV